jgi:hypothetical protein
VAEATKLDLCANEAGTEGFIADVDRLFAAYVKAAHGEG